MLKLRPFLRIDEKLSLHLARPELAEPIYRVIDAQREYLRKWLPWVDPTRSVEDTMKFIRESMQQNSSGDRLTTFLLYKGQLAGSLSVVKFTREHNKCEIGYWLREDLQGKGIMTRALAAFCEHLFTAKSMNRIEILIASGNEKSKGVPSRLGFSKEGVLRQGFYLYGKFINVELFSLLKQDWQKRDA